MSEKYIVVKEYKSQYTKPIRIFAGESVSVGKEYTENPEWKGWIWCENKRGEKGWVLERVLKIDYDSAIVIENYDATELSASEGEVVEGVRMEAGWVWCSKMSNETGWLPERNLKQLFGDLT